MTVTDDQWYHTIWKILVSLEQYLSVSPGNNIQRTSANGKEKDNCSYDSQHLK